MKTKFIKISVSERLPKELESVFTLHDKDNWLSSGYVDLSNTWFDDSDDEVEIFPTHWLEEVEDKAPELLSMLESIVQGFESDYVVDGEIVDSPYEWLQDRYKEAKALIEEATNI